MKCMESATMSVAVVIKRVWCCCKQRINQQSWIVVKVRQVIIYTGKKINQLLLLSGRRLRFAINQKKWRFKQINHHKIYQELKNSSEELVWSRCLKGKSNYFWSNTRIKVNNRTCSTEYFSPYTTTNTNKRQSTQKYTEWPRHYFISPGFLRGPVVYFYKSWLAF